jgi:transcriptional regulator with XRE-family HTH domain
MEGMNFHEKVVTLCAERDWEQADLWRAVKKKVSRTTVSNWFNGVSRPDMDTALLIARALDVPLDYLADDAQDEPPARSARPDWERTVIGLIEALGLDEREVLRRLATPGAAPQRRDDDVPTIDPRTLPPPGPRVLPGAIANKPGTLRKKQQG